VIPFSETSVFSKVVVVVMPEIFVVLTVMMMLMIMMILILLGFEGVVSETMRITVMGINLLIVYSNWIVDICWTWGGSK
jgi:hypothetical protein